jgi:colicin import membrane protein
MFRYVKEHWKGLTGTLLIHGLLVLVLVLFGFMYTPTPKEEGLLINFGTEEQGSGIIEPTVNLTQPEQAQSESAPSVAAEKEQEEILTQKFEEAPAVKTPKTTTPKVEKTPEQIEAERIRQAELERQRQADLERQRKEEEQRKIQDINNRVKNAFASGKNTLENTATGEGETAGEGNQGKPQGAADATLHADGGGTGTEGISYDIAGRSPQYLPKPEYNSQKEGKVVVEITVDRNGNVTQAVPGVKGSNTLDEYLLSVAKKAAEAAKFDKKPEAPAFQKGTITYYFILE